MNPQPQSPEKFKSRSSHHGYCHFVGSRQCICDVIHGYLAWKEIERLREFKGDVRAYLSSSLHQYQAGKISIGIILERITSFFESTILSERESCAEVAETLVVELHDIFKTKKECFYCCGESIAQAIRARNPKERE